MFERLLIVMVSKSPKRHCSCHQVVIADEEYPGGTVNMVGRGYAQEVSPQFDSSDNERELKGVYQ